MTGPAPRLIESAIPGLSVAHVNVAEHLDSVARRFGPAGLGVIDLPPLATAGIVPAQVRVCGVLYWAFEIEQAGLLPFVEALAEGIVRGTIAEPIGAAVPALVTWWRGREYRFAAEERRALFERIFGGDVQGSPGPFADGFRALVTALVAIGRQGASQGTGHLEARAAVAGRELAALLSDRGTGIAAFAARNMVEQIRTALRLLQHEDLVLALGGGGPWALIQRHAPRLLGRPVSPDRCLARAVHGIRIIEWLATVAESLNQGTIAIARTASVIGDAEAWGASAGGE